MLHNFIVTYVDSRGVIKKEYVEGQPTSNKAAQLVKRTCKVKQMLGTQLALN